MRRQLAALAAALTLGACAGVTLIPPASLSGTDGWTPVAAGVREVGLGLPGGAHLADGVRFAGGLELIAAEASPLHSLSDLKISGDQVYAVTDAGDLTRFRLNLNPATRNLIGVGQLAVRRLTLRDGRPIVDKVDGDAEGLLFSAAGDLVVSFERDHRLWSYGQPTALRAPLPIRSPDFAFASNAGMEAIAAGPGGWRVAGESGGVWDCSPAACVEVVAPPATPLPDDEYRITGMDRDPSGDGWFVVQRSYRPPVDARARIRRMAPDGSLGPVLIELKLPGTTDNFEGVTAEARQDGVRLYLLSDDNGSAVQRTLLLAFDVRRAH